MGEKVLKAYKSRKREQVTQEQYEAELKSINSAYFRLFETNDGKFVLEHLVKTCLATPIAMKGDDMLDIGERQGRANLVNEIIQRIERERVS